jgi:hypothetical protein
MVSGFSAGSRNLFSYQTNKNPAGFYLFDNEIRKEDEDACTQAIYPIADGAYRLR